MCDLVKNSNVPAEPLFLEYIQVSYIKSRDSIMNRHLVFVILLVLLFSPPGLAFYQSPRFRVRIRRVSSPNFAAELLNDMTRVFDFLGRKKQRQNFRSRWILKRRKIRTVKYLANVRNESD